MPISPETHASLYLSGPMTGYPDFNFREFRQLAMELRELGFHVINPAELENGRTDLPYNHYLRRDVAALTRADAIAVLKGWRASKGANIEVSVAAMLDIPLVDAYTLEPVVETILEEAQRICYGDRAQAYGHPYDDYRRSVEAFNALTGHNLRVSEGPLFLQCVKMSRMRHCPKRDNATDLAGYADVEWRCIQREMELKGQ